MQIHQIPDTNIYFGSRPGYAGRDRSTDCKELIDQGFNTLISFSDRKHAATCDPLIQRQCRRMEFFHIETTDHVCPRAGDKAHVLTAKKIEQVVSLLRSVADNPDKKIYMYCGSGDGRSQTYALAFIMQRMKCSMESAANRLWGKYSRHTTLEITDEKHRLQEILAQFARKEGLPDACFSEGYFSGKTMSLEDCMTTKAVLPAPMKRRGKKSPPHLEDGDDDFYNQGTRFAAAASRPS